MKGRNIRRSAILLFLITVIGALLTVSGCRKGTALAVAAGGTPVDISEPLEEEENYLVLVYMSGDNDLEYQALTDLNEMEAADSLAGLEVLILMDRSPGWDSSMGDWTGTRLYRLRKDRGGMNYDIVSERTACPPLQLGDYGDYDELNLGVPGVLSAFIGWGRECYPDRQVILIIWGHGTGWRSPEVEVPLDRAFSFDDSDCDFLYTSELGQALREEPVDMAVFDTCSAGLIENGWEIADGCRYLAGSEDLIPSGGFDYQDLFGRLAAGEGGIIAAGEAVVESFQSSYSEQNRAVYSLVDTAGLAEVRGAFFELVDGLADEAESSPAPEEYYQALRATITEGIEDFYSAPGDLNIDLGDLGLVLQGPGSPLAAAVEEAVLRNFTSGSGNPLARGIAVHLAPLDGAGGLLSHDEAYCLNSSDSFALRWVEDNPWCPDPVNEVGFLYHLLYGE